MSDPKDLYEMDPQELRDELDWYRRLYPHVSDVVEDAEMSWTRPDLRRFLEANPKP